MALGETNAQNRGDLQTHLLIFKGSQNVGGVERLGNHPTPAEAKQDKTGPHGARERVRVPTWDVEMARSLLVGGGGGLAVGQDREAGRAPATFTASRRKSKGSGQRAEGKQSRVFQAWKLIPSEPRLPCPGSRPNPLPRAGSVVPTGTPALGPAT